MPALCKHCGQPVRGEYITALCGIWHPEHFLCAGCGRPLDEGQFRVSQDRPYHVACFLAFQAPRCAWCGQPIEDSYTTANGQNYHPTCYREHVSPRCVYCQKPLVGRYLIDGWGNQYCEEHEKQYPRCSFCDRLIPPQQQTPGWKLDGSLRCVTCRSTAVEAAEQAQPLFAQLKQWIGQQGFRFNQLPLSLELWEGSRLQGVLRDRSVTHPLGVTLSSRQMLNGRILGSHVEGVAVLIGLPATLFSGVVLHELGHAWLTVHEIEGLPQWAEEGFCQLLSYRYYTDLDTPEARYRASRVAKDTDPIYGDGFRRVRALAERMGFAQFVETLRATRRLPASS